MEHKIGKGRLILRLILATVLFSIFLKLDSLLGTVDVFVAWGWSLATILLVSVLIRMVFGGIVVLVVLPLILPTKRPLGWKPEYLRIDPRVIWSGLFSFGAFCVLGMSISLGMGIFKGNLSSVLATPDLRPDPDVIGWGYFALALVPGIWEELAFRGLIQSNLRKVFSNPKSILLSSAFFALFHFSNLVTQSPAQVIPGVIMAFCFGIGWGYLTSRVGSVVPAMISHYLVDSMGQVFLGVDNSDPALATIFFLLLTLTFPVANILLTKVLYKEPAKVEVILDPGVKSELGSVS